MKNYKKWKKFSFVLTKAAIKTVVSLCVTFETVFSPILSFPVMSCHVMSCHVMSCPVLSCYVLSCPVLPCLFPPCYEVRWCMHVNIKEIILLRIQTFLRVVEKANCHGLRGIFLQQRPPRLSQILSDWYSTYEYSSSYFVDFKRWSCHY